MASMMDEGLDNEDSCREELEELQELHGLRDGNLFIIDATPPMFKNDPQNDIPYFLQSIRLYKDILKQKLIWDRQDWMGLTLFGTDKWDTDSDTKHILTIQKLSLVSMDGLKEIINIDEGKKWEYYRDNASTTAYPLHNVLWHAARAFNDINIKMPLKRVILFTCQNNPPMTDDNEKHRIRVKATSYSDNRLNLSIIGLGKDWNHDLFYKDLEMLSGKIDADDYKRTSLQDLVQQVKVPSRNMAKLPWRLGENVTIDVSLRNFAVSTNYLKKKNVSKETNSALITSTHFEAVDDDTTKQRVTSPILEMDLQNYQHFGCRNIYFTLAEVRTLHAVREPGIDLICLKPISYHPIHYFRTPYFVVPRKGNRKDNKLLFGALLDKCDARNLMIICVVTLRKHSAAKLYTLIPNAKSGGFYLYPMPFKENIRQINDYLSDYMYDNNTRKPPIDANGVEVLKKLINKLSIEYEPKLFSNPKLQVQLQTVETLALDLEKRQPPPDDTLPRKDEMRKLAGDLLDEYDEIFFNEIGDINESQPKKRVKRFNEKIDPGAFEDEEKIRKLVINGQIETCTATQLKTILKTLSLKTSGKKEELINRIKDHC